MLIARDTKFRLTGHQRNCGKEKMLDILNKVKNDVQKHPVETRVSPASFVENYPFTLICFTTFLLHILSPLPRSCQSFETIPVTSQKSG